MSDSDSKRAWFSRQISENLDALYGAALRLARRPADAEDLVADSVVRAWAAIDSLQDRDRFRPWMFRILRNQFISDCRSKSARPAETGLDPECAAGDGEIADFLAEQPDDFLGWWSNPELEFFNELLGEQIKAAIERLPTPFREVILLINVHGLGYDEAATVLGIPSGTVRSRMKRGRTLLQKSLWRQARDAGLPPPKTGNQP